MVNKVYSYITSKRTISWLIIIVSGLFVISLYHRYIYIDDAWFGEQAYWFSQLGYVKTSTIIDFYGWDNHLFVYHKLNIILGSILIKLFGWSPEPFRIFTLTIFLFFLFLIYKSIKKNSEQWSGIELYFVMFFVILNPQTILYAYTFRPEILVMSLGFASFLLLFGNQKISKIVLSGILAGTAVLVHLNGAMFVVAGFIILLLRKEIKFSIIFGFFAAIIICFYFYDLQEPGNFDTFLFQIKNWPDDITTNYANEGWISLVLNAIVKLSSEHQRFFWSHDVWGLSAIAIFALVAKGKTLWRKYKELIVYTLVADLSLNIFGSHIAEVNMLLLLPFLALIAAAFLSELKNNANSPVIKSMTVVIIIFQIAVVIFGFVNIIKQHEQITEVSRATLSGFPDNQERILVPYRFVFNELPSKNLISYKTMEYHQVEHGSKFTKEEFLDLAEKLDIYYMVVSSEMYAKSNSMYPWMHAEFSDIDDTYKYIKLRINKDQNTLERIK